MDERFEKWDEDDHAGEPILLPLHTENGEETAVETGDMRNGESSILPDFRDGKRPPY
jgi:hypothetical protein